MKPGQLAVLAVLGLVGVVLMKGRSAPAPAPAPVQAPATVSSGGGTKGPTRRQAVTTGVFAAVGGAFEGLADSGVFGRF